MGSASKVARRRPPLWFRGSLLVALHGIAAAVAVSCAALTGLDDFTLTGSTSASGAGGPAGGAGGVDTGSSFTSSSAGSGGGGGAAGSGGYGGAGGAGPVVVVPCGTDQWHVDACPPSEFCCWHESFYSCDVCSEGGTCTGPGGCGGPSNYRMLRCSGPEDCPAGQQCCEDITQDTLCAVACSASQNIMCTGPEHCPMEKPYCIDFTPPYPGYRYCSATQGM